MSRAAFVAVSALAGGCTASYWTTTAQTTETWGGTTRSATTVVDTGELVVQVQTRGAEVAVRALRGKQCHDEVAQQYDDYTVIARDDSGLWPSPWLPRPLIEFPPLFGADGESAGVARRVETRSEGRECDVPSAGVPIVLALPSGTTLAATSDARGMATFTIPTAEPDHGTVTAHVGPRAAHRAAFNKSADCAAERSAIFVRAMAAPDDERTQLLSTLPSCADPRTRAWSLTRDTALAAVAGDCERVAALGRQVCTVDPPLYDAALAPHGEVTLCMQLVLHTDAHRCADLPPPLLPPTPHEQCVAKRRLILRSASNTAEPETRTLLYQSLPHCD